MSSRVFPELKARIGGMHDIYFTMRAQSFREGRSILLGPGVLIALAVSHLTRELLVALMRLSTEAKNSELVVVRAVFSLINY